MKRNISKADRLIRFVLAAAFFAIFYFEVVPGTLTYVALGLGIIMLFTSIANWCAIYALFGISTCPSPKTE